MDDTLPSVMVRRVHSRGGTVSYEWIVDNMARALWIYDVLHRSCVAVLVHRQHVINAHWDPVSPRLALCTGTDLLFIWSPEGSTCIPCDSGAFLLLVVWDSVSLCHYVRGFRSIGSSLATTRFIYSVARSEFLCSGLFVKNIRHIYCMKKFIV